MIGFLSEQVWRTPAPFKRSLKPGGGKNPY